MNLPIWLPTFGDARSEWWAIARLPDDDVAYLKELVAHRPGAIPAPRTPPGPPPGGPHGPLAYKGTFDENDLAGSMPSIGHPMRDAAPWLE